MSRYIVEKIDKDSEKIYDDFVKSSKYGDLLQTYNWSKVKKGSYTAVRYVMKNENGDIVSAAQLMYRKLLANMKMCYISRGPIFSYDNLEEAKIFIEKLKEIAKKDKATYMIIDPPIPAKKEDINELLLDLGFKRKALNFSMEEIQPRFNMIVDISHDIEAVVKNTNKICKNMLKASEKMPFIIINPDDKILSLDDMFEDFYSIMKDTAIRDNITVRDISYFKNMYNSFKDDSDVIFQNIYIKKEDAIKVLKNKEKSLLSEKKALTKKNKNKDYSKDILAVDKAINNINISFEQVSKNTKEYIVLATIMVIISGNKSYYLYGGSTELFRNNGSVYKNCLVGMEVAKNKGCVSFDMGGVSGIIDHSKDKEYGGLYKFKSNWGADMVEYIGEYRYDIKPFNAKVLNTLINIRKKLVKR